MTSASAPASRLLSCLSLYPRCWSLVNERLVELWVKQSLSSPRWFGPPWLWQQASHGYSKCWDNQSTAKVFVLEAATHGLLAPSLEKDGTGKHIKAGCVTEETAQLRTIKWGRKGAGVSYPPWGYSPMIWRPSARPHSLKLLPRLRYVHLERKPSTHGPLGDGWHLNCEGGAVVQSWDTLKVNQPCWSLEKHIT